MPPCTMPNSALGFSRRSNSAMQRRAQRSDNAIDARASSSLVMRPFVSYGVHSSNCITMSLASTVWICMLTSGVRNRRSPFTGEAKRTPSSLMVRIAPSDHT